MKYTLFVLILAMNANAKDFSRCQAYLDKDLFSTHISLDSQGKLIPDLSKFDDIDAKGSDLTLKKSFNNKKGTGLQTNKLVTTKVSKDFIIIKVTNETLVSKSYLKALAQMSAFKHNLDSDIQVTKDIDFPLIKSRYPAFIRLESEFNKSNKKGLIQASLETYTISLKILNNECYPESVEETKSIGKLKSKKTYLQGLYSNKMNARTCHEVLSLIEVPKNDMSKKEYDQYAKKLGFKKIENKIVASLASRISWREKFILNSQIVLKRCEQFGLATNFRKDFKKMTYIKRGQ